MRGIGQITVEEFYKGLDAAKDQGVRTEVARAGILVRPNFVSSPKYRGCVSGSNRPPRWPIGRC
jgi:hypothetical protein